MLVAVLAASGLSGVVTVATLTAVAPGLSDGDWCAGIRNQTDCVAAGCGWCCGLPCTGVKAKCSSIAALGPSATFNSKLETGCPRPLYKEGRGCIDIGDRETCIRSIDGRSFLKNHPDKIWKEPCAWCCGADCLELPEARGRKCEVQSMTDTLAHFAGVYENATHDVCARQTWNERGPPGQFYGLPVQQAPLPIRGKHYLAPDSYSRPGPGELDQPPVEYREPASPKIRYPADPTARQLYHTLSVAPRILHFDRILTDEECDALIREAQGKLSRSHVASAKKNATDADRTTEVRTSSQAWLQPSSPLVRPIRARLRAITGIWLHEQLQILRYERGQHYLAHTDYYDPRVLGPQADNRAATFFLYLNTPSRGGETAFPRALGSRMDSDDWCNGSLRVVPRKGAGVLFYGMRPDGSLDPRSEHGGCDVEQGVKWAATLWFRVPTE